jgi:hypothetical protein
MSGPRGELIVYEENRIRVLQQLREGRVDYLDLSSWPLQDRFFAFLITIGFFETCSGTYPSPRKKQELPLWVLLACELLMKLHTTAAHSRLPGILKSGPILARVGYNIGRCEGGFNYKNKKPREAIVHHDAVRKFFKAADREASRNWYNRDFAKFLRRHRAFDKHGIFLLDQSRIVVPRNPHYTGVDYLPVDEFGHLIDTSAMSPEAKRSLRYRPCYTITELLHVGKQEQYFVVAGYQWGGGKCDELQQGIPLVKGFVEAVGKGVIKLLIMDRGYIDGASISLIKDQLGSDVMIPLRRNMQMLHYGINLAESKANRTKWRRYREYVKEGVLYVEDVTVIADAYTWEECTVPLHLSLMRTTPSRGTVRYWGLATSYQPDTAQEVFDTYRLRSQIEERYRQHKHFWHLHKFSSPAPALMETHVLFTLATYSLLQLYLNKHHLTKLANKTIDAMREKERQGKDCVIIYKDTNFAVFDLDFYTYEIADLKDLGRERIKKRMTQLITWRTVAEQDSAEP